MKTEKYTFSQVISTLIEIERGVAQFYEKLSGKVEDAALRKTIAKISQESIGRVESLNRVRQLTVTEFSLEPITGLDLNHYMLQFDRILKSQRYVLDEAKDLEDFLQKLYRDASTKLVYSSPDASELLVRFSKESQNRKAKLTPEAH